MGATPFCGLEHHAGTAAFCRPKKRGFALSLVGSRLRGSKLQQESIFKHFGRGLPQARRVTRSLSVALFCWALSIPNVAVAAPDAAALVNEAAVRFQLGDDVGVVRVLRPLLQNSDSAARTSGQAVLRGADMLWSQGDASHAWDLYQSVADRAAPRERSVALARLMRLAAKLGLWQEFEQFDRAFTRLNSRIPQQLRVLRAKVLVAQGRDTEALRQLATVKRGDPAFWSAEYLRGALSVRLYRFYRRQGEFAKAREILTQALQGFDTVVAAGVGNGVDRSLWEKSLLAKARVLQQQGEYRGAIKLYARVPKDSLRRSDALYESALAAKRLGDRAQRQATQSRDPTGGNRQKQVWKRPRQEARGFYDQAGQFLRRLQEHQAFICHPRRLGGVGQARRFCSNAADGDHGNAVSRDAINRVSTIDGDQNAFPGSARDVRASKRDPQKVLSGAKTFWGKSKPTQWVLAARIAYKQGLLGRARELYDDVLATYGPLLSALNSANPAKRAWAGQWLRRNTAVSIPSPLQERYRLVARMQQRLRGSGNNQESDQRKGAGDSDRQRLARRIRALEAGIDEELAGIYKPSVLSAVRLARRGQVDLLVDEKKSWTRRVESVQQQRNAQARRTRVLLSDLKDGGGR
ncbi:MAG: tetratricopeptide repeat protein [Myxococcota bacterium]